MERNSSIRTAELTDIPKIKSFLNNARFVHRHLDWRDLWDWIGHDIFLLEENKREKINAIFSCTADLDSMFWVRLFSTKSSHNYYSNWNQLFTQAIKSLRKKRQALTIYSLAYFDWMVQILEIEGWQEIERIIQFQWEFDEQAHFLPYERHPMIRAMDAGDLHAVHAIDLSGFGPVWQQSFESISASFAQSGYSSVYCEQGHILGFQISTIKDHNAHLARIAVHPDHRRKKIGELLVKDMLGYCLQNRIQDISVNTQRSNISSSSLYQKLGFKITEKSFPIFSYEI